MSEIENTAENTAGTEQEAAQNPEQQQNDSADAAKLRADLAKMKAAMDKATREASDYKKQLRAHQTAEEAAAEEAKTRQEAIEKELAELRKEKSVAVTSKRIITFVNDEKAANTIAEALYGAADIDQAVDEIAKAWTAREKALRQEYSKVPIPGVGSVDGPTVTKEQFEGMGYKERLDFHNKHPEEYAKLTGRTP